MRKTLGIFEHSICGNHVLIFSVTVRTETEGSVGPGLATITVKCYMLSVVSVFFVFNLRFYWLQPA